MYLFLCPRGQLSNAEAVVRLVVVVCNVVRLVVTREVLRLVTRDVVLQLLNRIAEAVVLVSRLATRWRWPEHERPRIVRHERVT